MYRFPLYEAYLQHFRKRNPHRSSIRSVATLHSLRHTAAALDKISLRGLAPGMLPGPSDGSLFLRDGGVGYLDGEPARRHVGARARLVRLVEDDVPAPRLELSADLSVFCCIQRVLDQSRDLQGEERELRVHAPGRGFIVGAGGRPAVERAPAVHAVAEVDLGLGVFGAC